MRTPSLFIAALYLSLFFPGMVVAAENIVFSKTFSDGTSVNAREERIDLKLEPNSPQLPQLEADGVKVYSYSEPADVCTIIFTDMKERKQIHRIVINYINMSRPVEGLYPFADWPYDFVFYDAIKVQNKICLLVRSMREVQFVIINLNKLALSINGQNLEPEGRAIVFDETWAKQNRDAMPILNAHIIPTGEGAYLFFESKMGNHFMWEVLKNEAHLVWKKVGDAKPGATSP